MESLPSWQSVLAILGVTGILTYGATEIVKLICRKWVGPDVDTEDPVWWQVAFRILPIALGATLGNVFLSLPWGAAIGGCAGIVNIMIYKKVTDLIGAYSMKR